MQRQSLHALANRLPACKILASRPTVARRRAPAFSSQLRSLPAHQGVHMASAWPYVQPRRQRAAAVGTGSSLLPEAIPSDVKLEVAKDTAAKEVTYDEATKTIKIPLAAVSDGQRRTKMVMFTCNKCGGRSARLVNPVAWEKGAVFCQCQHCSVWHTLRAAKHILEEIRYNDPNTDLGGLIEDIIFAAGDQPMDDGDGSEDMMQDVSADTSSQTGLQLPSDMSEEQEATSAAQYRNESVGQATAYNSTQEKTDSTTQTDSYRAIKDTSYTATQDSSSNAAHDSRNTTQDSSYASLHSSSHSAAHDSSQSNSSSYSAAHDSNSSSHSYDSHSSDSSDSFDSGSCGHD